MRYLVWLCIVFITFSCNQVNEFEVDKTLEIHRLSRQKREHVQDQNNLLLESFQVPPFAGDSCYTMISMGKQSFDQQQYILNYSKDGHMYLRTNGRWELLRLQPESDSLTSTYQNPNFRVTIQQIANPVNPTTDKHKLLQIFLDDTRMFDGTVYENNICK
ncbi:MAG: hypothetical protein Q4F57_07900 [Weeksellaceae bacterium]|nr:hypothetical protein [Weeksellaceae bacterium]